jgi:hypothetical protein
MAPYSPVRGGGLYPFYQSAVTRASAYNARHGLADMGFRGIWIFLQQFVGGKNLRGGTKPAGINPGPEKALLDVRESGAAPESFNGYDISPENRKNRQHTGGRQFAVQKNKTISAAPLKAALLRSQKPKMFSQNMNKPRGRGAFHGNLPGV